MNKVIALIFSLIVITGCGTQHFIQKAQFDQAIPVAVKKIRKKPQNFEEIDRLKYAYNKANQIDKDRLSFLFESGADDVWDEVHQRYTKLYRRQELVKTLPDEVLTQIGFDDENYARKITQSKQNAAEHYYIKGSQLLESGDKYDARDAYYYFAKAKKYYANYKDTNQKMAQAKFIGTNHILFKIANQTQMALPENFEDEMLKISLTDLNQDWISYDTRANKNVPYDYFIQLSLKQIAVGPNDVKYNEYQDKKEIEDGFKYLLDAKGNVSKDSLGNDIKLPVYKIINCTVRETHQHKETTISSTLDYINTATQQLVKTHPVSATMIFDHHSAEAFGDKNALSAKSRKLIGNKSVPFPTDPQIIMDAASQLKNNTKKIIYDNREWLKR